MSIGIREIIAGFAICATAFTSWCQQSSEVKAESPDIFIRCEMSGDRFYEREAVPMVLTLFSSTSNISYANQMRPMSLSKGEFASIREIQPAGDAYTEMIDGRQYYCYPLNAYMVTLPDKGSYTLQNGAYEIGIPMMVGNDSYWGPVFETRSITIPVEKKSFKVKALPNPPVDANFSGSVGKFTIETVIPEGDIIFNEEAVAYVVLRGDGMIAEQVLPDYQEAFKNNLKLKSISESRSSYYKDGRLISQLQLECTFIPTSRDNVEIGEVLFEYFNPDTGKYEVARTAPVKVTVKSSTVNHKSIEV